MSQTGIFMEIFLFNRNVLLLNKNRSAENPAGGISLTKQGGTENECRSKIWKILFYASGRDLRLGDEGFY